MIEPIESFNKLEKLVQKKGISFYALCKVLNIPTSFFSEWKRGKMMPKVDKLQILADYFEVPVTYFWEESKTESK